jgi:hypothetical protein
MLISGSMIAHLRENRWSELLTSVLQPEPPASDLFQPTACFLCKSEQSYTESLAVTCHHYSCQTARLGSDLRARNFSHDFPPASAS